MDTTHTDKPRHPEALSAVVRAPDGATAEHRAKLHLIADGRTPGTSIYAEDLGSGEWEVIFTDRPLRPGQNFGVDGVRYGNAGTKADVTR